MGISLRRSSLALFLAALLLPVASAGAAPTTLNFEITNGTYTTYPGVASVSFPQGVEVYTCAAASCGTARSGTRAARGQLAGEFARDPLEIVFSSLQSTVSLYVRADEASRSPAVGYSATLRAFNASNAVVDTQTATFQSSATWQPLAVGTANTPAIKRITVTGGESGFTTNFLAYDDVTFEGDTAPPPDPDTVDPLVVISRPVEGETFTTRTIPVDVRASDDKSLSFVRGAIESPTGTSLQELDYCGSSFSGTCPVSPTGPVQIDPPENMFVLPADTPNGPYVVRVEACDNAANCTTATKNFTLNFTEPIATRIFPVAMEINQAVQGRVHTVNGPGTIEPISTGVPILRGKATVIRFYFLGDGGTADGFTSRLGIRATRTDGSTFSRQLTPNGGETAINVVQDPVDPDERAKLLLQMRSLSRSSLNWVLPPDFMTGVEMLEFQLRTGAGPISGWMQLRPHSEARVGVNLVRLHGPGVGGRATPPEAEWLTMLDYVSDAFPVSEVRQLSERRFYVIRHPGWEFFMGHCGFMLESLWWALGGDDAPVTTFTSDVNIVSVVGLSPQDGISDSGGCAYVGDPDDDDDRIGGTNLNEPHGDTLAQEIGHNMGLIHASNSHGEAGGGDAESDWPYFHGTIGDESFGVRPIVTTPSTGGTDLGIWNIGLIDPCPTADPDLRYPVCGLTSMTDEPTRPHDFMSYGPNAWVSPTTYNRLNAAIRFRTPPSTSRYMNMADSSAPGEARIDSLIVLAAMNDTGQAEVLNVTRRDLPAGMSEEEPGSMTMTLFGEDGSPLVARSFEPMEVSTHDSHFHLMRQVFPYVEGLDRVVIADATGTVAEKSASPNTPTVEITSPTGGETYPSGRHNVTWTGSDADGDALSYIVQYSPDGGWSWQGIGFLAPGQTPLSAEMDVGELIPGRWGIVRVTVSDGINTATDESTFLSVGTSDEPGSTKATNKIRLRLKGHLKAAGKVRSSGPLSCVEGLRVIITRNGNRVKAVTTNALGRFSVQLKDASGKYQARTRSVERALLTCSATKSPTRRHRH